MTSTHRLACLAFALTLLVDRPDAAACSCLVNPDLEARVRAQEVLFVGRALDRQLIEPGEHRPSPTPSPDDWKPTVVAYSFEVIRDIRGTGANPAVVRTSGTGMSCGSRFAIGKSYIVFAERQKSLELATGLCSGNLEATPENIARLNQIVGDAQADDDAQGEPAGQRGLPATSKPRSGCAGCTATSDGTSAGALLLFAVILLAGRSMRSRSH